MTLGVTDLSPFSTCGEKWPLVVFEEGLFDFFSSLTNVVIQAAPLRKVEHGWTYPSDEQAWMDSVERHPDIETRFYDVLAGYLLRGHAPSSVDQIFIKEPYMTIASFLIASIERFVVAHEYAHVILGHLSQNRPVASVIGHEPVAEVRWNWEQEFLADNQGFKLAANADVAQGLGLGQTMQAVNFFFTSIWAVEMGLSVLRTGHYEWREPAWDSTSHPPSKWRGDFLQKFLNETVPPDRAEPAIAVGRTFQSIVLYLFAKIEPLLMRDNKNGRRPAPIWE